MARFGWLTIDTRCIAESLERYSGLMDDEVYKEVVSELAAEWRKDKRVRSMATVKNLFDQTSKRRRNWITSEKPLLSDILDKYPCLASSRVVRFSVIFKLSMFSHMDCTWPCTCRYVEISDKSLKQKI